MRPFCGRWPFKLTANRSSSKSGLTRLERHRPPQQVDLTIENARCFRSSNVHYSKAHSVVPPKALPPDLPFYPNDRLYSILPQWAQVSLITYLTFIRALTLYTIVRRATCPYAGLDQPNLGSGGLHLSSVACMVTCVLLQYAPSLLNCRCLPVSHATLQRVGRPVRGHVLLCPPSKEC